jgi:predicted protein tyrosine phosphatase
MDIMSYMNRMGNINNFYQGDFKKVLCVCSAGLLRSPTAAKVLAEKFDYNTRAAGIVEEYALIPVDDVLLSWADEVVFMEQSHYDSAIAFFEPQMKGKDFKILSVPDIFPFNDEDLKELILKRYEEDTDEQA